jgi:acetoin utilization deacetylase AcuC-like enzyme
MTTAYLFDPVFLRHTTGWGHPERPERLEAIHSAIAAAPYYNDLVKVAAAFPEMKYIELIHSPSYIRRAGQEIKSGVSHLDSMDTAVCRESYEVALMAVGGSLKMSDTVMKGVADNGFCAVRPPGHHAEKDYAAGFCIFNNIAIAARYIQKIHGIKKIAVVDWDVHHGNGTQHSFERDPSVLYISLHQFPHYPGTGSETETGEGKGRGYTMNIPMRAGSGDDEYLHAFHHRIIPRLEEFSPEIILISAGFDGHRSDPLSSIKLSSDVYAEFTNMLMAVADRHCKGRIVAFLEGGYNLSALTESVAAMMKSLVRA